MSYLSPFTGDVIQPTDVSYNNITLTATTQLFWSFDGNGTETYAARIMDVSTSNSAYHLIMPPASQASVGQDAMIRNYGSATLNIYAYGNSTLIASVAPSSAVYIYLTSVSTDAGTWNDLAFGSGASSVQAATLAGYGLLAISNTLNTVTPVTTFSASQTTDSTYLAQTYVWVGGAGTLTLGSAASLGNSWYMNVRNSGTGALNLLCQGSDTINGSANLYFNPGDSAIVVCSGGAFYTVGLGRNTNFAFTQLTKSVTNGTYVLTTTEASNVIMKFVGTLTANVTIQVPPSVQVYYIENATVGGVSNYTVTITTGVSGGANATIGSNLQSILICDSINLVNANTILAGSSSLSLPNGTAGAPSLYFSSEPTTGVYRANSGEFDISILGVNLFALTAGGLQINGSGTFTGGVSGGTF